MTDYFENTPAGILLEPSLFGIILFVFSFFGRLISNHSFSGIITLLFRYDIPFFGGLFGFKMRCFSTLRCGKHILQNNNILQFSRAYARKDYLEEKKKRVGMNRENW